MTVTIIMDMSFFIDYPALLLIGINLFFINGRAAGAAFSNTKRGFSPYSLYSPEGGDKVN